MRPGQWSRRVSTAGLCLGLIAAGMPPGMAASDVQVGRYATVRAVPTPEQRDLLVAQSSVSFPESVVTVGEAVNHLLQPSGYRLSPQHAAEPFQDHFLQFGGSR